MTLLENALEFEKLKREHEGSVSTAWKTYAQLREENYTEARTFLRGLTSGVREDVLRIIERMDETKQWPSDSELHGF